MTPPHSVVVRRGRVGLRAECEDCRYFEDEIGTSKCDNARQRAKAHAKRTGHTVFIVREHSTYLNPR